MDLGELEKAAEEAPIVKLVNLVLTDAVKRGARTFTWSRTKRSSASASALTASADDHDAAAEVQGRHHVPHEDHGEARHQRKASAAGRPHHVEVAVGGKKKQLDFRVSTLPTLLGEKIVMRLLDKENLRLDMTKLGFEPESLVSSRRRSSNRTAWFWSRGRRVRAKPTRCIRRFQLNKPDTNIMTAEDPVEFKLPGVNQVQMKEEIGLTFAAALRASLDKTRHHPGRRNPRYRNGGNRHQSRAHRPPGAFHAAHQRRAVNNRGLRNGHRALWCRPPVDLICAQRLVRRICKDCSEVVDVPHQALIEEGYTPEEAKTVKIHKGKGCGVCNNTGYKGRTGLYEVMEVDDEIRELVLVGASAVELKKKAD